MNISEFQSGDKIIGQFLLADAKKGVKENGSAYWSLQLQDSTGVIEAKKWDFAPQEESFMVRGNVVQIEGEVLKYRNALQVKVYYCDPLDQSKVDFSRFIPVAPMSLDEMKGKLEFALSKIEDEDIATLTRAMVERFYDKFLVYPAAVRNHHEYYSGLLFHSLSMIDVASGVCRVYPNVNRDLVFAGILIHDLGKTVELSGTTAAQFTMEGKLLGHISIGHAEFRRLAKELGFFKVDELSEEQAASHPELLAKKEKAVLLEHILLSHHSKPEFGSPQMPCTREALVVAMIDDLDAKMAILDKAYRGVEPGTVTAKLFNMDDRYFYKPLFNNKDEAPGLSLEELKKNFD
ncbi:MAG: HD domain-containing protein [Bacilli bacterium]|nr:HD domain-containing protein [Bacilli bacterium]